MNRFKLVLFSCFTFVVMLAGCQASSNSRTIQDTTAPPVTDPATLYAQAASKMQAADELFYYVGTTQTTVFEGQEFTRSSQQHLNIQDPGKETMRISVTETLQLDAFSVDIAEFYENGNGYVTLNGNSFTSPLSPDAFTQRYAPAVCFDPSLYGQIEGISRNGRTQLSFRQPSAAEKWALPADAVFTDAYGYAELSNSGDLKESVYTLSYTVDNTTVTQTTRIILQENGQVMSPDNIDTYIPIKYFDGPRMLEQACGYLQQAENISSTAETSINCQTFSISRNQVSDMKMSGSGEEFSAQLNININQTNQSRGGETTQIVQSEAFEKGVYSICVNGGDATQNEQIDAAAMKSYCQDMLLGDILLPRHITDVSAEESDHTLTLTFQASDIFAEAICSNICNLLYSDAELLHTLSSSYETQSLQCILSLDTRTGLPLLYSSEYSALHNIEDIAYRLESKTEQSYQYTKISGH